MHIKKGFTLLETSIVLLITSSILIVGYVNIRTSRDNINEKVFLKRFDMNWKNMYRLTTYDGYKGSIDFDENTQEIIFLCQRYRKKWVKHLKVPPSLYTRDKVFNIGRNGVTAPGKVIICDANQKKPKYDLTVQMGWGVYEIKRKN